MATSTPAFQIPVPQRPDPAHITADLLAALSKVDSVLAQQGGETGAALTAASAAQSSAAQALARALAIEDPVHVGPTPPTGGEALWIDTSGTGLALKAETAPGVWGLVAAGADGAQGPAGPASPHEGSNIAVSVKGHGAVGDGTTDDTTEVQAALTAAAGTNLDFEAGTYVVTGNLGPDFWAVQKAGPGVISDGAGTLFRITPRDDADVNTIFVHGTAGDDGNDGLSPARPLRTLAAVRDLFSSAGGFDRGQWVIRLSGTITGGVRFQNPPHHKLFLRFEGDPLDGTGRPTTWIESDGGAERFGLRFEEGQQMRVHLARLGFSGFDASGGMGWLIKSGGFIRAEDCWTEGCDIGSGYVGNVGFSEQRSRHQGYRTSGTRAQYNASGSWTEVQCLGGPLAHEGFHTSRQAVTHVDKCLSENHTTYGAWSDMSTRVSYAGSTIQHNGIRGIRGEGSSDVHIDNTTYGPNVFADNGRQDVSIRGTARLAAEEGIYAIPEHLVDARVGAWTAAVTAYRGLRAFRIGTEARLRIRAWGDTGGTGTSLAIGFGSTIVRTVALASTLWMVEMTALHDGTSWQIVSTLNGAGTTIQTVTPTAGDLLPVLTPGGGARLRGFEIYTGG